MAKETEKYTPGWADTSQCPLYFTKTGTFMNVCLHHNPSVLKHRYF